MKKSGSDDPPAERLLATLVQTHSDERVLLDASRPSLAAFEALLSDRVTGTTHPLDGRLLAMLRTLSASYEGDDGAPIRIELVSGYRSPKLNEMLRKKGHHVASHSQHSLGHACDFRVVLPGKERPEDPRALEERVRALGWTGGVGIYPAEGDGFVHIDVGPNRRWQG